MFCFTQTIVASTGWDDIRNDPAFIAVDLEFDTRDEAERFELGLQAMWRSPEAARVLGGSPRSRVVEVVEQKVLDRPAAT